MRFANRVSVASALLHSYRKPPIVPKRDVCSLQSSWRLFCYSSVAGKYLERMFDHDVKGFLEHLRMGVFERDDDFRAMFNSFQRYLPHLNSAEIVEIIEMIHSRDVRENDEGFDLIMLLICEMNQRLISGKEVYFSLKQIHRICSILKHVKFNRPSYLIATSHHAVVSDSCPNSEFDLGFRVLTSFTPEVKSHTAGYKSAINSPAVTSQVECTEGPSNPADVDLNSDTTSCYNAGRREFSDMSPQSVESYSTVSHDGCEHHRNVESDSECLEYRCTAFQENYPKVLVPVCESNTGILTSYHACQKCCNRYGKLLQITGHDHLALLIALVGRSIVLQSRHIRKRHENAVTTYLILSSHLNCTMNSHIVRTILADYLAAFVTSKSLRNVAIAIQTAKKCKVRCSAFTRKLIGRLADVGNFEHLCANERNTTTLLIAFNQIVSGVITTNKLPIAREVKQLGINIVTYLVDNYERIFCSSIDQDTLKSVKGSTKLMVDYLAENGVYFNRILLDCDMEKLHAILADGKVEYLKDFKTSDLHKQVASVLSTLGVDYDNEVYISPHYCDLLLKKDRLVLEIDGPYHFCTGINHRINQVLKRNTNEYWITYTHNSRIKRFILGIKGYKVVHIPYFRWPTNRQEQLTYTRKVIA